MSGPADTYDDWLRGKPDRYEKLLRAAGHALRSYEFGNAAPDSAKEMADAIDAELASGPAQGPPAAPVTTCPPASTSAGPLTTWTHNVSRFHAPAALAPPSDDEWAVVLAMAFGGSFTKALGEAFGRADRQNFARLRAAFPELWNEYLGISRRRTYGAGAQATPEGRTAPAQPQEGTDP